ncbi:MAG: RNA-binding protein [Dehalococcoidia bacterium]
MRIYVGNFAYEMREQELREAFEAYGQVQEVSIVQDRETGRSKGFAFVEMAAGAEAQAAIGALNGKEFAGRTITVNEARPRPERSFGGGGGGFGNRGPGGPVDRESGSFGGRGGRSGGGGGGGGGGRGPGSRSGGGGFHNARKSGDRDSRR